MTLNKEQLTNLITLLKIGKFSLNADEATVLANLKQDLEKGLQDLNIPKEEVKEENNG